MLYSERMLLMRYPSLIWPLFRTTVPCCREKTDNFHRLYLNETYDWPYDTKISGFLHEFWIYLSRFQIYCWLWGRCGSPRLNLLSNDWETSNDEDNIHAGKKSIYKYMKDRLSVIIWLNLKLSWYNIKAIYRGHSQTKKKHVLVRFNSTNN